MTAAIRPQAAVLAVILGATTVAGLWWLSRPPQLTPRLERVEAALKRARAVPVAEATAPLGAVCAKADAGEINRFQAAVAARAAASGLKLSAFAASPPAMAEAGALKEVGVSIKADGSYAATVNFLESLAQSQPSLLVSMADVRKTQTGIELSLTGAFWCHL